MSVISEERHKFLLSCFVSLFVTLSNWQKHINNLLFWLLPYFSSLYDFFWKWYEPDCNKEKGEIYTIQFAQTGGKPQMILRGQIPPSKYFSCPRKTLPRKPKNFTKKSKKMLINPKGGRGQISPSKYFFCPRKSSSRNPKKITKKSKKFHQEIQKILREQIPPSKYFSCPIRNRKV